jgi:hypothetical protein
MIPGRFSPRRIAAHEDPDFYAYSGDGVVTPPPPDVVAAYRKIGRRVITFVDLYNGGWHIRSEPVTQVEL